MDRWTQQLQSHVGRLLILSSVELTRLHNVSSSVVMTDRHRQQLLRSHQSRRDIGCFRKLNLALKQMLLFHHVMFVFCLRVLVWRHASYFIFNFHFEPQEWKSASIRSLSLLLVYCFHIRKLPDFIKVTGYLWFIYLLTVERRTVSSSSSSSSTRGWTRSVWLPVSSDLTLITHLSVSMILISGPLFESFRGFSVNGSKAPSRGRRVRPNWTETPASDCRRSGLLTLTGNPVMILLLSDG